jgi:two-component system sensor histidine kinase RegB
MHRFLDELVDEWRSTRTPAKVSYFNRFGDDLPIVSDSALKQTIANVLDNALEASPAWVGIEAMRDADDLKLVIEDSGPGFSAEMIEQVGKPYRSSKGRPGGGLGLFLVTNVLRTLGGRLVAANRAEGGASVTMTLPLAALTREPARIER